MTICNEYKYFIRWRYGGYNGVCCTVDYRDGVTTKFATYKSPLSGLKAMSMEVSNRYGGCNGVCCAVDHRDGVAIIVCHIHIAIVGVKGNVNWT